MTSRTDERTLRSVRKYFATPGPPLALHPFLLPRLGLSHGHFPFDSAKDLNWGQVNQYVALAIDSETKG